MFHCMYIPHFLYLFICWWTLLHCIYIAPTPWLLYITLQWVWECRFLFEILILIPLRIYPEVGLIAGSYSNFFLSFLRNFQTNFHSGYAKFTFFLTGYSVLFLHDILNKSSHIKVQLDIFLVFDWEDTWNSFIWKSVSLNIALKPVYPSLLPMLVNNSIIIHPKLMPAAWKSFLILPVFIPCVQSVVKSQ